MARVRDIEIDEVPEDVQPIYKQFATQYGPFLNQVRVFGHRPTAVGSVRPSESTGPGSGPARSTVVRGGVLGQLVVDPQQSRLERPLDLRRPHDVARDPRVGARPDRDLDHPQAR